MCLPKSEVCNIAMPLTFWKVQWTLPKNLYILIPRSTYHNSKLRWKEK